MSDQAYRNIIVACLVALSVALLVVARQRDDRAAERDAAVTQNTVFVRELIAACTVRPDGSLDSCGPNTILVTTTAVLP